MLSEICVCSDCHDTFLNYILARAVRLSMYQNLTVAKWQPGFLLEGDQNFDQFDLGFVSFRTEPKYLPGKEWMTCFGGWHFQMNQHTTWCQCVSHHCHVTAVLLQFCTWITLTDCLIPSWIQVKFFTAKELLGNSPQHSHSWSIDQVDSFQSSYS